MIVVTRSGPLFDGRAAAEAEAGTQAVREALAAEGERLVQAAFGASIQGGTGRFLASVTSTSESRTYTVSSGRKTYALPVTVDDPATTTVVTTNLASYGPWLEGTGSRNQTTRFKGYHGFRQATQELDSSASSVAEGAFAPFVEKMS
jgi:hypothetical protein